jgi:isoquinoline 1-oxidoreductase subunit alpha
LQEGVMEIIINGEPRNIEADSSEPLLWVLRDDLGLTGTKYGCGIARCGACTVLVDGIAVRSCVTPVSEVVGKRLTTIEGAAGAGFGYVQEAWVQENVPQCGYCQPGQIMSACALLSAKQRAKEPLADADIDVAMSGNLCRCGTYPRIRKAIKRASTQAGK